MPFLRALERQPPPTGADPAAFPFNVPVVRAMTRLEFATPVTFFLGENGSGKSTLLEGIAAAVRLPVVGSTSVEHDATLSSQRLLARALKLEWSRRTTRGFFLRAEDFFGFAKSLQVMRRELQERVEEIDVTFAGASDYAKGLAKGPARGSLHELEHRYGADLDANSHGQSFLRLFQSRFVPEGLYLLDEPEAALSPQSQLALLAMLKDMVAARSQFLIATHSPMLLAFPGATILDFDQHPPSATTYDESGHVQLYRSFLEEPGRFLRHL
jgi:predicted ATPase